MPQRTRSTLVRYGRGLLAAAVALAAIAALRSFDLEGFLFAVAVAVAVWFGGRGTGVLALVLAVVLLHHLFLSPGHSGAGRSTYPYFGVFAVLAVAVTALSEARQRRERSIAEDRDELERKVQERTAELRRSEAFLLEKYGDAELRRSERRYRNIFQTAGVAIVEEDFTRVKEVIDELRTSGVSDFRRYVAEHPGIARETLALVRVTDANDAAVALFGAASREQFLGALPQLTTREVEEAWVSQLVTVAEGRNSVREVELTTLRGEKIAALVTVVLPPESSDIESVLVTVVDLTERRRAQEALSQAQTALAHVTRVTTLGELAASIAHEVSQPLSAIMNNASASLALLPQRSELDDVRAALADIGADAERASAVIERVRALARRAPLERVALRLRDVVSDVAALAASESATRRVMLRWDVAEDVPTVSGDRVQLQQVLLNLVVNGMDAMTSVPERDRLLEIRARSERHDGEPAATISVRDRGVGLGRTDRNRLFDAFYSTKPHGMGMGLAISRSIVEAHGGRMWAEPNPGPGATFSFTLPAK